MRTRQARRRELRAEISDRASLVDLLIGVHTDEPAPRKTPVPAVPRLKRYRNE